jgi:hypothetical protein
LDIKKSKLGKGKERPKGKMKAKGKSLEIDVFSWEDSEKKCRHLYSTLMYSGQSLKLS